MIRGLRPDVVVMMPLTADATEMMDRSPEKAEQKFPKEVLVAYKEAKALSHCTVVCDDLLLGMKPLESVKVLANQNKPDADLEKRMKEVKGYVAPSQPKESVSVPFFPLKTVSVPVPFLPGTFFRSVRTS